MYISKQPTMRLDKLTIHNFKNLQDFSIDFDEESLTTVLVGQNGTGKSNLLEALVMIFRDLDLHSPPPFAYRLSYLCRGRAIEIDADPTRTRDVVKITVDKEPITYTRFVRQAERQCLPHNVFGYYSGVNDRLESHFETHQEKFYRALLQGDDQALRPLFYARLVHSQFVLLSFFTQDESDTTEFLSEYLGIEGLESVLFVMNQPPWKSKEGDSRFWNARGVVQSFLDKLYEVALAPMRLSQRVSLGLRKSTTLEHLYLYIPDAAALRELASSYSNQQEFFKTLESTYISELIKEVRIRVKVRNVSGTLTFRELSEGEQQLLTVLGLLRFTKEEESLFLLDEPDTHLNPTWSVRYLDLLRQVVGTQDTSHIIIATHDPLVIAGLEKSQVQIMQRDEPTGQIFAETPDQDPKGMGVAAILTSELFGLRSSLDLETLHLLDRKRELAAQDSLSSAEKGELDQLNELLGNLDFTRSVRDPLYDLFVKAMAATSEYEQFQKPVLTAEERLEQRELAIRILQDLLEKQSA
jgi:predicted ATPase